MATDVLENCKIVLRSILTSSKNGVESRYIEKEYGMFGDRLPYRTFNFTSGVEFVKRMCSDTARLITRADGTEAFVAIATEETQHIADLVKNQKTVKSKRGRGGGRGGRGGGRFNSYRSTVTRGSYNGFSGRGDFDLRSEIRVFPASVRGRSYAPTLRCSPSFGVTGRTQNSASGDRIFLGASRENNVAPRFAAARGSEFGAVRGDGRGASVGATRETVNRRTAASDLNFSAGGDGSSRDFSFVPTQEVRFSATGAGNNGTSTSRVDSSQDSSDVTNGPPRGRTPTFWRSSNSATSGVPAPNDLRHKITNKSSSSSNNKNTQDLYSNNNNDSDKRASSTDNFVSTFTDEFTSNSSHDLTNRYANFSVTVDSFDDRHSGRFGPGRMREDYDGVCDRGDSNYCDESPGENVFRSDRPRSISGDEGINGPLETLSLANRDRRLPREPRVQVTYYPRPVKKTERDGTSVGVSCPLENTDVPVRPAEGDGARCRPKIAASGIMEVMRLLEPDDGGEHLSQPPIESSGAGGNVHAEAVVNHVNDSDVINARKQQLVQKYYDRRSRSSEEDQARTGLDFAVPAWSRPFQPLSNEQLNSPGTRATCAAVSIPQSTPTKFTQATKCSEETIEKVHQLVRYRTTANGIKYAQLEIYYEAEYGTPRPDDFEDIIRGMDGFTITESLAGKIVYPARSRAEQLELEALERVKERRNMSSLLDSIELPKDGARIKVFVSRLVSSTSVVVQLATNSSKLHELEVSLMACKGAAVTEYRHNHYCLAVDVTEKRCYRVRMIYFDVKHQEVEINCLDYGFPIPVKMSTLYEMPSEMKHLPNLPYQAIECTLTGFEQFSEDVSFSALLEDALFGKYWTADIDYRVDRVLSLTLLSLEDATVRVVDELFIKHYAPCFPSRGESVEAGVSSISEDGTVYLRMLGPAAEQFERLSTSLQTAMQQTSLVVETNLDGEIPAVVLVNNYWVRMELYDQQSDEYGKVCVSLVDFGDVIEVDTTSIYKLPAECEGLKVFPYQATVGQLAKLPPQGATWTARAVEKLISLIGPYQIDRALNSSVTVVVTTCTAPESDEDCVIVDVSTDADGSVSDVLCTDSTLWNWIGGGEACRVEPREVRSSSPPVPNHLATQYNDAVARAVRRPVTGEVVIVVWAESPSNFRAILYSEYEALIKLMTEEMNPFYNGQSPSRELLPSDVHLMELYAGHYADNWYRVRVMRALHTGGVDQKFQANFVDFGDSHLLSTLDLRFLPDEFQKLPLQAIHMKLDVPRHTDEWTSAECELFQSRTFEQNFCVDVKADENWVMSVVLTDLQTAEQVHTQLGF